MTKRPLGLKIISWWFIIGGGLSVVLMAVLGPALAKEGMTSRDMYISAGISALIVIAGAGLLKMKKWAWYMGFAIESLLLAYEVIAIPFIARNGLAPSQVAGIVIGLVIYGVIITYLLRQDIRELYGVSRPASGEDGA